jgi:hypothetical protein
MLTKYDNLQKLDFNNNTFKNNLHNHKTADKLRFKDYTEIFIGPVIFAMSIVVWVYLINFFGV